MFAKYRVAAAAVAAMMPCLCAAAREEVTYLYGSDLAKFYGSDLAKYCAAPDQTTDYMVCDWFITGAVEVIVNNPSYGLSACPPHMIDGPQAVKLTRSWLAAHPEQELRPGSYVVAAAVAEAFPARNNWRGLVARCG